MKCSCPKCHTDVELELTEVPEEGTRVSCTQCKARFTVVRESFGARALRKTGEITCAQCGGRLGSGIHCETCGALYPSYLATTLGARKARARKVKLTISPFPQREQRRVELPRIDTQRQQAAAPLKGGAPAPLKKHARLITAVVVLLAVSGAAGAYYQHDKSGKEYTKTFIKTIYCTRVGEKKAVEACARMIGEWKNKADAGDNTTPHPGPDELRDLSLPKEEMDLLLKKLHAADPPKDLAPSLEKLDALCTAYDHAYQLATSPSGNPASFSSASARVDGEYRAAAKALKATLPPKVLSQIKTGAQRYKGLQGFLEL